MKEIIRKVNNAILKIAKEFRNNRKLFLNESDMKCRVYKLIDLDKTYISNGHETFLIHTEIALKERGKTNKVDILIAKFEKLSFNSKGWKFKSRGEDIGIELKFNYDNYTKNGLKNALKTDKDNLTDYNVTHRYIVCFDHDGLFKESEINNILSDVHYIYVDGKKNETYTNLNTKIIQAKKMKCPHCNKEIVKTDKEYFRKEYAWVIDGVSKLITKEEAIELYNSELHDGLEVYFNKIKKKYPKLEKYRIEKEISMLMLSVALTEIGEIE